MRVFAMPFTWLVILAIARGSVIEIAVAPDGQTGGAYSFSVITNGATNGLTFHIVITNKIEKILAAETSLSIVSHAETNGPSTSITRPIRTFPSLVNLESGRRILSSPTLNNPVLFSLHRNGAHDS